MWFLDEDGKLRKALVDSSGRPITFPEARYTLVPPTLLDGEIHNLTLTSDGKLRVDDPTTQAAIADIEDKLDHADHGLAALKTLIDEAEAKLDHETHGLAALQELLALIPTTPELEADAATRYLNLAAYVDGIETLLESEAHGLAALKILIDAIETKLDTPSNFMADLSDVALEATLETIMGVGWTFEDLKAIYDFIEINHTLLGTVADVADAIEVKLDTPSNFMADTTALALASVLQDAMQKATGPAYNQDTDSLEALREAIDGIAGGLVFTEIADQNMGAHAYITPTVNGIFTAVISESNKLSAEIYIDSDGAWKPVPLNSMTGIAATGDASIGIVGQAYKIRWENNSAAQWKMVVNRVG